MNVLRLTLEHYRNLKPNTLTFSPGSNVIWGNNAQGKTNLLEAIWLFTGGHSFRGAKDGELVAFGEERSALTMDFFSEGREQTIELLLENGKRKFTVNGVEKKSGAELVGKFCGVIFSPEHLSLVKGGPLLRRSFLDGALCQSRPGYAKEFVLYQRTLRQRNMLLKDLAKEPALLPTLEIWNQFLAERGMQVIRERQSLLQKLKPDLQKIYSGLSHSKEAIDVRYVCSVSREEELTEELFLERLKETEKSDLLTGYTTVGPHRDDLEILIDGVSARMYGSQGQQRSAVLSLKLAEAGILEAITGEKPVVLLDDVMSELDADRQEYLLNHVKDRQIFITCCDPHSIRSLKEGALFYTEQGVIRETGPRAHESEKQFYQDVKKL